MSRRLPAALALALLLPAPAEGHAFLVKASPARRAVLSHPPARVELWFSERLEPAYSSVTVTDAAGTRVDFRDVTVGPDDPRRLTVSLPPLMPGRYVVTFRVLSVDGHVVESSFPFTVK
ncbi:MAG: copper resistance protein CopC [Candidatus Rokubacteria bacterium]|nr:copper resistance protein CopC [Candidatus Rokubacteria bacterium]